MQDILTLDPLWIKWIHILSAILLFGTGFGTAFHGLFSHLGGDIRAIAIANRNVVWADWLFTTPTVIIQPISGIYLMIAYGWAFEDGWLQLSILLYAGAGLCWLPVVYLQIRMRQMARQSVAEHTVLPARYHLYHRLWILLGIPAFAAMIAITWLMIFKPDLPQTLPITELEILP